jgi:uncharacterized protein YegJ (DUF2314 family)
MYKALPWKNVLVICVLWLSACQSSTPKAKTYTEAELNEAIGKAQETLYILRRAFLSPEPSYAYMSVKVRFSSTKEREDMWTEPVDLLGDVFVVHMIEGVTIETGVHPERYLNIPTKNIVDWMIVEKDGSVLGGYTLRLEYKYMTPDEQAKYRKNTGYKFE